MDLDTFMHNEPQQAPLFQTRWTNSINIRVKTTAIHVPYESAHGKTKGMLCASVKAQISLAIDPVR